MWMIMLVLGVVYVANDDEYSYSMTLTIWMCDQSMLGVFYSNVGYALVSYDVIWVV